MIGDKATMPPSPSMSKPAIWQGPADYRHLYQRDRITFLLLLFMHSGRPRSDGWPLWRRLRSLTGM